MTHGSPQYSVVKDHLKALIFSGKFITIHTRKRHADMNPYINGQTFPGMGIPRIEIYYPLAGGDTRGDVIAHECAHICYSDMRLDKTYPEIEAINIMANIEPELLDFYSGVSYVGEECVVRLADLRRQGGRLPRMSPRLSAIIGTLARRKPVRAAMFCLIPLARVLMIAVPMSGVLS